jgi:hypothetical protein
MSFLTNCSLSPVRYHWVSLQNSLLDQKKKITFEMMAGDAAAIELQVAAGA